MSAFECWDREEEGGDVEPYVAKQAVDAQQAAELFARWADWRAMEVCDGREVAVRDSDGEVWTFIVEARREVSYHATKGRPIGYALCLGCGQRVDGLPLGTEARCAGCEGGA